MEKTNPDPVETRHSLAYIISHQWIVSNLLVLMFVYHCEYSYCGLKPVVANLTTLFTDKAA
jgi:hypothetical protein